MSGGELAIHRNWELGSGSCDGWLGAVRGCEEAKICVNGGWNGI